MTCQICNAPGRVTDHLAVQRWAGEDEFARSQTLYYFGGSDYYQAARNARAMGQSWGGIWGQGPITPCPMCVPEPAPPPRARAATPPRPPRPPSPPRAADFQAAARKLSQQAGRSAQGGSESFLDKLKRTSQLASSSTRSAAAKVRSTVSAAADTAQATASSQVEAGSRMVHRLSEAASDVAHSVRSDIDDIAFGLEQSRRVRQMCREQTYESGARCVSHLHESFTRPATADEATELATEAAIAGATRSSKAFVIGQSVRGAAAILRNQDCRDFVEGSATDNCARKIMPRGFADISTKLPNPKKEGQ